MFELPNAKRIRRDDMRHRPSSSASLSPSPSLSPVPEEYQEGHERLGKLLNFDTAFLSGSQPGESRTGDQKKSEEDEGGEEQEEEFEFRLFGHSTQKKPRQGTKEGGQPTQKLRIRLRSPTPGPVDPSQGRFVRPSRGWEYYFTTPRLLASSDATSAEDREDSFYAGKRRQFEDAAVTGTEMMRWSEGVWPGCHYSWRVMHLKRENAKLPPRSRDKAVYVVDPPVKMEAKSRRKPGKKRRIQLRKREVAAEQAKETEAEKRNRKNRERKIKRRQKAREMKAAGQVDGSGEVVGEAVEDQGSEDE